MALTDVRAPHEQSEGTRSQVLRWLKNVGDAVAADEPLLELETDKVTIEIAAPVAGVLREISKQAADPVTPSELLGRIEAGSVARPEAPVGPAAAGTGIVAGESRGRGLSPAVRRLIAEHGVDPAQLTGTGLGGRVTAADVLRHVEQTRASPPAAGGGPAPAPAVAPADAAAVRRVPHSPMRRRIAERMVESLLHTAPHVTTVFEADLAAVLAHRARHRHDYERRGTPLTLTAYFLAACVDAVRAVPEANARWTDAALEIHERLDIGVATALGERGLIVPVVRDVAALDLPALAAALADLTARARADRLTPADVRGGTFTVSNHGVSGSLIATPIVINQPQSAILGVGRLEKRAVVLSRDGEDVIAIRPRCYVSLTIDHRVMDGERANRFLAAFTARLEAWTD
ncbi:MAG: 2-oxo acid dehydrogenase subunit E2 [Proteobacteria bacterium]|nr:2-oxo acid dehydrogenase subunit E2 [Pseudomonadota bacterium]